VLGYIVLENGIYAIGVAMVGGVPSWWSWGCSWDIFVAVFIMSIAAITSAASSITSTSPTGQAPG